MTTELVQIPHYTAGTWTIDPVHSSVGFAIRHLMISKVRGRFSAFEGTLVTAEDPLQSTVTATIDMTSVDTANEQRNEHLRGVDFFETEKYPSMTYRSTGIRPDGPDFTLDGELTLKGVTRPVSLKLEVHGFSEADPFRPDPATGARAGFTATGEINRHDFGVVYDGPVPDNGAMLGEKVQIILEIEAVLEI